MAVATSSIRYLRFVLHNETDGILMARKRPTSLTLQVPELRETTALLRALVDMGVEKIRLAGDDPALREDLGDIVEMIAGLDGIHEVAMTTRGIGLSGKVAKLAKQGLNSISFNIDGLRAGTYRSMTGSGKFKQVRKTLDEALAADLKVKLNVVLRRGVNDKEIGDFVGLTREHPVQVRFLEWNSGTDTIAPPEHFVSTRETMAAITPPLVPQEPSVLGGPALVYGIPEHAGTIGFIPNITEHFCGDCNRIGLTDTGEVLSCIYGRGLSLVRHLRSRGGATSVSAFLDRVLRRKLLLASKLQGFPGTSSPAESLTAGQIPG
ncbi:radical SAM protein [Candidatus Eisenbacteria bacterium]|uniref:Radical SAM protein n=1 Tax=Eiseniibacteriota bacterium TaxID=2212470 RepID=A0ABV6YI13_UNCEI